MVTCPIWGTPAKELAEYIGRDGSGYFSPRAGGKYFLSRTAHAMMQNLSDKEKVLLTHEIVSGLLAGSTPEVGSWTVDQARRASLAAASVRADRLLNYLVKLSPYLGAELHFPVALRFYPERVPDALTIETGFGNQELYAWSDSLVYKEVDFLLRMLAADDFITLLGSDSPPNMVVGPKGYSRVEEVRVNPSSEQVFVAMWFDESMNKAFSDGLDPGIRAAGYRPLRIDRKEHLNKVDDEIVAEIRRSRFLVADFTSAAGHPRGGVYFEAGFAMGLGLDVVWCCRHDMIEEVHFDTRQFNHIVWKSPEELRKRLTDRILATIGEGPLPLGDEQGG